MKAIILFLSLVYAVPACAQDNAAQRAYDALTDSEQRKVDEIRAQIKDKLNVRFGSDSDGLSRRDLEWAWNGPGRRILKDELLAAAAKGTTLPNDLVQFFKLTPTQIIEYSLHFPDLLTAHSRAKHLLDDTELISDRTLEKYRDDPLLKPFVLDRIKRFRDPAFVARVNESRLEKLLASYSEAQKNLADRQAALPELRKKAAKDKTTASNEAANNCEIEISQWQTRLDDAKSALQSAPGGPAALAVLRQKQSEQEEAEQRRKQEQKDAAERATAIKQLRHTFTAGKFTLDAIPVKVDWQNKKIDLIRMDDKRLITVDLDKLSDSDQSFIGRVSLTVKKYGKAIADSEASTPNK